MLYDQKAGDWNVKRLCRLRAMTDEGTTHLQRMQQINSICRDLKLPLPYPSAECMASINLGEKQGYAWRSVPAGE